MEGGRVIPGYNWYFPLEDERIPDLQSEQVVEVWADRVSICGSAIGQNIEDCRGRFVGPIEKPAVRDRLAG